MRDRGTMKTTRMRKIECPGCGLILRGSRNPLLASGLPTCGCGCAMQWADAEDAYACLNGDELYAHPLVQELERAEDRRLYREQHSHGGAGSRSTVGQCGGCRKPITATNEDCARCGFSNDLRGRRNHGGYADAMPF
jgi:hypothetical protein